MLARDVAGVIEAAVVDDDDVGALLRERGGQRTAQELRLAGAGQQDGGGLHPTSSR